MCTVGISDQGAGESQEEQCEDENQPQYAEETLLRYL